MEVARSLPRLPVPAHLPRPGTFAHFSVRRAGPARPVGGAELAGSTKDDKREEWPQTCPQFSFICTASVTAKAVFRCWQRP